MDPPSSSSIGDPTAARVYADAIATMIAEKFPRTFALWVEGRS